MLFVWLKVVELLIRHKTFKIRWHFKLSTPGTLFTSRKSSYDVSYKANLNDDPMHYDSNYDSNALWYIAGRQSTK